MPIEISVGLYIDEPVLKLFEHQILMTVWASCTTYTQVRTYCVLLTFNVIY